MHVADGDDPGIVNLFANHAKRPHNGLPSWEDGGSFTQERERRLECLCKPFHSRCGKPQPVRADGSCREIAELDQVLRRDIHRFPAAMQFRHGRNGQRMCRIAPVCQTAQNARVDENCRYS